MNIPKKRELQQIASNYLSDIDFKDFMIFYKDMKEPYSFLVNDTTLSSDSPLQVIIKMRISEKIKTINNKIKQNKAQCNLDRQTPKILA